MASFHRWKLLFVNSLHKQTTSSVFRHGSTIILVHYKSKKLVSELKKNEGNPSSTPSLNRQEAKWLLRNLFSKDLVLPPTKELLQTQQKPREACVRGSDGEARCCPAARVSLVLLTPLQSGINAKCQSQSALASARRHEFTVTSTASV